MVTYAKMLEQIIIPFGLWAWTGPRNHKLDGCRDLPMKRGNFWIKGSLIVKYRDFLP